MVVCYQKAGQNKGWVVSSLLPGSRQGVGTWGHNGGTGRAIHEIQAEEQARQGEQTAQRQESSTITMKGRASPPPPGKRSSFPPPVGRGMVGKVVGVATLKLKAGHGQVALRLQWGGTLW